MNENKRKRDGGVGPKIQTQMPRTNKLVDINRKLSDAQRSRILKTPFRYLVEMKTYIGMKGLPILGESLPDSVHSKLKVLQEEDNIDDFCRVYILFAFSAASKYHQQKNDTVLHISGCSAVLQIWAVEHLSLCSGPNKCFPCINNWTKVEGGHVVISNNFSNAKLVEELVPTQEDMENDVLVKAVNHSEVGIGDGAYPLFDVQAYMAEHQRLVGEHKYLLSRVSILEDDMRILKSNSVHSRENISMPSSVEVGSGSKQVGVKCGKIDADNDGLKSEAGKPEENDDGMKLDDEGVGEEEKKNGRRK
ncbi:hypothetical protein MTR_8g009990 [Medicago truncatula]|uniref:Uncharacterized protein n=1 Tax=Medicago truncatula TaxID=3880 RepID=A0A072TKR8_MEDTR|nr:hypothetical protein MTR_8g009990 [Medicago truncatula]